jgi:hypothetical protein
MASKSPASWASSSRANGRHRPRHAARNPPADAADQQQRQQRLHRQQDGLRGIAAQPFVRAADRDQLARVAVRALHRLHRLHGQVQARAWLQHHVTIGAEPARQVAANGRRQPHRGQRLAMLEQPGLHAFAALLARPVRQRRCTAAGVRSVGVAGERGPVDLHRGGVLDEALRQRAARQQHHQVGKAEAQQQAAIQRAAQRVHAVPASSR